MLQPRAAVIAMARRATTFITRNINSLNIQPRLYSSTTVKCAYRQQLLRLSKPSQAQLLHGRSVASFSYPWSTTFSKSQQVKEDRKEHAKSLSAQIRQMFLKWKMSSILNVLRDHEPDFSEEEFLEGARHAVYVLYELIADGDTDTLKPLLGEEFQQSLDEVHDVVKNLEVKERYRVYDIMDCELVDGNLLTKDDNPYVQLDVSCVLNMGRNEPEVVRSQRFSFQRQVNTLHPEDERQETFEYRWVIDRVEDWTTL